MEGATTTTAIEQAEIYNKFTDEEKNILVIIEQQERVDLAICGKAPRRTKKEVAKAAKLVEKAAAKVAKKEASLSQSPEERSEVAIVKKKKAAITKAKKSIAKPNANGDLLVELLMV